MSPNRNSDWNGNDIHTVDVSDTRNAIDMFTDREVTTAIILNCSQ